ncbi:hypothetical protein EYZ11_002123 [Aspergillus tanneri]|uniref:VOC domain-containing protein n=1 Tax=Aspergillus tanneri TaxID=1220188 RepID=A0A4V3UQB6_9EURO|nr:uncharacterized protein ATNIH1004_002847 [Aspergillus tanneri]KAA8650166.1 hypothetical protein ATNIH1004_002847 [Aspergillus tanneri]THC98404.1 hypothetical protein EYZ11_002123 [Aspergillus tanneri]
MAFDHIGIRVPPRIFSATLAFYLSALKPLGYKEMMRPIENCVGLGVDRPEFFLTADHEVPANQKVHLAFKADNHTTVDTFYSAGVKAGGTCNGPPGPRPEYNTPTYYAAFVLDPAGNNIEAAYE